MRNLVPAAAADYSVLLSIIFVYLWSVFPVGEGGGVDVGRSGLVGADGRHRRCGYS